MPEFTLAETGPLPFWASRFVKQEPCQLLFAGILRLVCGGSHSYALAVLSTRPLRCSYLASASYTKLVFKKMNNHVFILRFVFMLQDGNMRYRKAVLKRVKNVHFLCVLTHTPHRLGMLPFCMSRNVFLGEYRDFILSVFITQSNIRVNEV